MSSTFITSYERDNETDLDFAQARMHDYNHGRFTSPDPLLSSGRESQPQTWNRYSYVLNNPLIFIDPDGLYEWDSTLGGNKTDDQVSQDIRDKRNKFRDALKHTQKKLVKQVEKLYGKGSDEHVKVQAAIAAYGCESGVGKCTDNTVIVAEGSGKDATAQLWNNKTQIKVTLESSSLDPNIKAKDDTNFVAAVVHEGVHASDFQDFMKTGNKYSDFDFESRGFIAESAVGHAMMVDVQGKENSYNNAHTTFFDPKWRGSSKQSVDQQRNNIRSKRNSEIDSHIVSRYNLQKAPPTYNYYK